MYCKKTQSQLTTAIKPNRFISVNDSKKGRSYRCKHNVDINNSSAVAEKPRDALCPSVVSLNKIITRAEFFFLIVTEASDLPLRNVVFGVTLRLLEIHFVVVSHHQQTRPLYQRL